MTLFVEIVYVIVTIVLILVVLLQAGRGGGLGTALGGGASQGVFGGGGGADFLAKLTQGLATAFMVCAVYLAYASSHTGSDRLKDGSDDTRQELVDADEAVNYEMIGEGTPQILPEPGGQAVVPTAVTPEPAEVPEPDVEDIIDALDQPVSTEAGTPAEPDPGADVPAAVDPATPKPATPKPAAKPATPKPATPKPAAPATDAEAPTAEPEPAAPATDAEAPTAEPNP